MLTAKRAAVAAGGQHAFLHTGMQWGCCCSKRLCAPVPASAAVAMQQLACASMRQPGGARLEVRVAGECTAAASA